MTKEWCDNQTEILQKKFDESIEECCKKISEFKSINIKSEYIEGLTHTFSLTEEDRNYIVSKFRKFAKFCTYDDFKDLICEILTVNCANELRTPYFYMDKIMEYLGFTSFKKVRCWLDNIEELLDSEWVEFDGDIVITDPCYTMDDRGYDNIPLCRDTIYGDWSCTTFNTETEEPMGNFCADGAKVCVDTLENILERFPNFLEKTGDWCYTLIKNFKGKVKFSVEYFGPDDESGIYNINNYEVRVIGDGIDGKTGKKVSFLTTQTGF